MIIIPLTQGYVSVVSDEDYEAVAPYTWSLLIGSSGSKYCIGKINSHYTLLHRHIMQAPDDRIIDHADRNGLNNLRSNLRFASFSFNARNVSARKNNTSGFKGVAKSDGGWVAYVTMKRKRYYLGYFRDKYEAAKAYDVFVLANFGEAAATNESLGYFMQSPQLRNETDPNHIFKINNKEYVIVPEVLFNAVEEDAKLGRTARL